MKFDFTNKKVLITGGSRGIGRAAAIAFAQCGAQVAVNYRSNAAAAQNTVDELTGPGHFLIQADISDPQAVRAMVDEVHKRFGRIDVLVNNAGIYTEHALDQVDYEAWQEAWRDIIDTNLVAAANLTYCGARYMIADGGGSIVNISSRGAFRGEPDFPAYGASKGGLNAMSQSLAKALGKHNISVTAIAPGFVETDMATDALKGFRGKAIKEESPFNRVALPEEIAYGILFYASDEAKFMTGGIMDINGASYLRT